jgi:hypothetical protein
MIRGSCNAAQARRRGVADHAASGAPASGSRGTGPALGGVSRCKPPRPRNVINHGQLRRPPAANLIQPAPSPNGHARGLRCQSGRPQGRFCRLRAGERPVLRPCRAARAPGLSRGSKPTMRPKSAAETKHRATGPGLAVCSCLAPSPLLRPKACLSQQERACCAALARSGSRPAACACCCRCLPCRGCRPLLLPCGWCSSCSWPPCRPAPLLLAAAPAPPLVPDASVGVGVRGMQCMRS